MELKPHTSTKIDDLYDLIKMRDENEDEIYDIIMNSEIHDLIKKDAGGRDDIEIYTKDINLDSKGNIVITYQVPELIHGKKLIIQKEHATISEEIGKVIFMLKYKKKGV